MSGREPPVAGALAPEKTFIVDAPTNGTAEVGPSGIITYTPALGFDGVDSFTHVACTDANLCGVVDAEVTVTLTCTIEGTDQDDIIEGTPGDDVICAAGGNDTVFGGGGNDVILGETGNDTLFGGAGDDLVLGGAGLDIINGQSGDDTVDGGGQELDVIYDDVDDLVAPVVAISSPAPGTEVGVGADLVLEYACTDAGSGVEACQGPSTSGALLDTTMPGTYTVEVVGRDWAGNEAVVSVQYVVGAASSPPAAVNDDAMVLAGETIEIDVLANDNDPDGDLDDSSLAITRGPATDLSAHYR